MTIESEGHRYRVVPREEALNTAGKKNAKLVESRGRPYEVYEIEVAESVVAGKLQLLGVVLANPFKKEVLAEKKITHLAVDILKEKNVADIALKYGLLPQLEKHWFYLFAEGNIVDDSVDEAIADEELGEQIIARNNAISAQKEHFRQTVAVESADPRKSRAYSEIDRLPVLKPNVGGQGGAYFLCTNDGKPRFVLKPNDEDILCLHNRKKYGMPFFGKEFRIRKDIPTYQSAQNEALGYDISQLMGAKDLVPLTVLTIQEREGFHLATDGADPNLVARLIHPKGKEKLCSAQEFVDGSEDLVDAQENYQKAGGGILQINQTSLEFANIFVWVTGDEDAHTGNYRVMICLTVRRV